MSESNKSLFGGEPGGHDHSRAIEWWLRLDSGWQATVLGLVGIVCSFAVRLF
jgi:hypothetical protein